MKALTLAFQDDPRFAELKNTGMNQVVSTMYGGWIAGSPHF